MYHAAPGSAFTAFGAVGITFASWATLITVAVGVAIGGVDLSIAITLGQVSLLIVPVIALRVARRDLGAIGVARPPWQYLVAGVLVGVGAWYLNLRLLSLLPLPKHDVAVLEQIVDQGSLLVTLLTIGLLPAICEEILFRGVLLRGLGSRFHAPLAIGMSALTFSLYHLNLVQLIPTFTLGLVLGLIALRAGSSFPTMIAHALNNSIALLVARGELGLANREGTGWIDQHPTLALAGATATTTAGIAIAMIAPRAPMPDSRVGGR